MRRCVSLCGTLKFNSSSLFFYRENKECNIFFVLSWRTSAASEGTKKTRRRDSSLAFDCRIETIWRRFLRQKTYKTVDRTESWKTQWKKYVTYVHSKHYSKNIWRICTYFFSERLGIFLLIWLWSVDKTGNL